MKISVCLLILLTIFYTGCGPEAPTAVSQQSEVATTSGPAQATPEPQAEPDKPFTSNELCKTRPDKDRRICSAIAERLGPGALESYKDDFTYIARQTDLNGDGRDEILVRVPPSTRLGGSSGYPVFLFSEKGKKLRAPLYEEQMWTPIIMLPSKTNGWNDIAIAHGGGGQEWGFSIFKYNGRSYKMAGSRTSQPKGKMLIEKDYANSFYGPL